MENGQLHDDKLFRAVHDRLSDYEAPANGADWDAMSRSLDTLPKATRFQWKISLNTILVAIGVIGISVLGYAVATHTSGSDSKSSKPISVTQNKAPQKNNITVNNPSPIVTNNQSTVPVGLQMTQLENPVVETNALTNTDGTVKTKKHNNSSLLFGDQIDPRKGFIYKTQENNAVVSQTITDPNPNVFYDSENGNVKKIILKKDSTGIKGISKPLHSSDSTANNSPKKGTPTNGDQQGFGGEGN